MVKRIGIGDVGYNEEEDETLLKNYQRPRYFICPECAELTTWKQILDDCSCGGQGMCMCKWGEQLWDEEEDDFDFVTNRIYVGYIEISKRFYLRLKKEKNEILRLNMFNQIPKDKLLDEIDKKEVKK